MTREEALALIRSSAPYQNTDGVLDMAWTRWALANPNEATKLDQFVAGETAAPQLATKFGRGWVALLTPGAIGNASQAPPAPVQLVKGAIVVVAGNMNVDLLRQAGVTHVCVEMTEENLRDFNHYIDERWQGFTRGGFHVSRGEPTAGEVESVVVRASTNDFKFLVIDTESHKTDIGGSLAWTDTLYAALRSKLGTAFPLYNITFGIHSSPAVVNHIAFQRYNVTPIWEAYDENGNTYGVDRTAEKAELEGWTRPHLALGDKTLVRDALDLKAGVAAGLGGVWLWAADNGPAQEALAAGVASTLRGLA
jgi:hypothetical protein